MWFFKSKPTLKTIEHSFQFIPSVLKVKGASDENDICEVDQYEGYPYIK